jgi:hypothetical protein
MWGPGRIVSRDCALLDRQRSVGWCAENAVPGNRPLVRRLMVGCAVDNERSRSHASLAEGLKNQAPLAKTSPEGNGLWQTCDHNITLAGVGSRQTLPRQEGRESVSIRYHRIQFLWKVQVRSVATRNFIKTLYKSENSTRRSSGSCGEQGPRQTTRGASRKWCARSSRSPRERPCPTRPEWPTHRAQVERS